MCVLWAFLLISQDTNGVIAYIFIYLFIFFLPFKVIFQLSFYTQDLVVHVRDVSHPECDAQLDDVMTVLEKQLSIKAPLMETMIEAQNKIDLWYVMGDTSKGA